MAMTILVPLDGSELAEKALPFASAIATTFAARVVLVQAAPFPGPHMWTTPGRYREERKQTQTYLEDTRRRAFGPEVAVEMLIPEAEPGPAILHATESRDIDLVIMSTHGRGGLTRALLGSVAEHVLRESPVPVLPVSGHVEETCSEHGPRRFVVPLDATEHGEEALVPAFRLACAFSAHLVLVEAADRSLIVRLVNNLDEATSARQRLGRLAETLTAQGVPTTLHIGAEEPSQLIAEAVLDQRAELIVMATHARTQLDRLILGGIADEVLRSVRVPVLLVRQGMGGALCAGRDVPPAELDSGMLA